MVWRFLIKLRIKPPYDPTIPLLGIYPEETKTEKDTCTPMLIAALFTIGRTWNQPRCPSTDEWIKSSNEVLIRWMNLEPIIQSEVSQKEKYKYIQTHIYGI